MGDPSIEVTEEKQEAARMAKSKAVDAMSEGMIFKLISFGPFT